jgi:hypothetical protein
MRGLALLVAVIAGELIAGAGPAVAKAEAACDLISAQGVAAIVGGPMENDTPPGSPDSLCDFGSVGDVAQAWLVTVTLFTPRTIRQQNVGRAFGVTGGCRALQCKKFVKAMKDGSPGELYDAQTHGPSFQCHNARLSCFITNANILWAKHGDHVVAILATHWAVRKSPEPHGAALTQELGLLNYVSPRL